MDGNLTVTPRVSVVILSHRPKLVGEALASVFDQTFTGYQVVVQFCRDYWPEKLSEACGITRGEFLLVLCDDDKIAPTYLEETVKALDENPAAAIAYTDTWLFGGQKGDRVDVLPPNEVFPAGFTLDTLRQKCVPWVTALMRRSLYEEVGGYDPRQTYWD